MEDFRTLVYNVVSSNAWSKDKVYLLKRTQLQWKTLGHTIDPSIYRGKKHLEHVAAVNMTKQLPRKRGKNGSPGLKLG